MNGHSMLCPYEAKTEDGRSILRLSPGQVLRHYIQKSVRV